MKRSICTQILSGECTSLKQLKLWMLNDYNQSVSLAYLSNTLRDNGIRYKGKTKRAPLSKRTKELRYNFARDHIGWDKARWKRVIFLDESKFQQYDNNHNKFIWTKSTDPLATDRVQQVVRGGGENVQIWGCVTSKGPGKVSKLPSGLNGPLYCRILDNRLMQTLEDYDIEQEDSIIIHDNCPSHNSKIVDQYIEDHGLIIDKMPPYSPDINIIETLWYTTKNKVCKILFKDPKIKILEHLREWDAVIFSFNVDNKFMQAHVCVVISSASADERCEALLSSVPRHIYVPKADYLCCYEGSKLCRLGL
eukprot:gene19720-23623_t